MDTAHELIIIRMRKLHDYFKETWEAVREAHRQGQSLEEIKRQCSLDGPMARLRSVFDVQDLPEIHDYNVELLVKRLSQ